MRNGDHGEQRSPRKADQETAGRSDHDRNRENRGKWVSALLALIGLWLVIEMLVFELSVAQLWNDLIVGSLLLATAGYNYYEQRDGYFGSVGAAAIAALLGLWLVLAPFVLGTTFSGDPVSPTLAVWNDFLVGAITFALGAYSAYTIRSWRHRARAPL